MAPEVVLVITSINKDGILQAPRVADFCVQCVVCTMVPKDDVVANYQVILVDGPHFPQRNALLRMGPSNILQILEAVPGQTHFDIAVFYSFVKFLDANGVCKGAEMDYRSQIVTMDQRHVAYRFLRRKQCSQGLIG